MDKNKLTKLIVGRSIAFWLTLAIIFVLTAGTWRYWEAWVYLAILFIPWMYVVIYLLRHDPDLLERRMRFKEKEKEQKILIRVGYFLFALVFIIPGIDKRVGWSYIPWYIIIIADVIILLGYMLVIRVFMVNSYASRIIEVEQKQQVITTGPYAYVRHPMYSGVLLMYVLSPLALGSYWGLIPSAMIIALIIVRILNEERVLSRELNGYQEYIQKTKYRLIPGIW